jgi:acyl-CoA synthetase (AMP-forming)/AMP-acid ligase II
VRGPAMFVGYVGMDDLTEYFTPDGFFLTGDIGRFIHGDGLVITGRKKDLIVRGGENISAVEIEDVIAAHPDVHDIAVVSMQHPRLGEGVCAFLVASASVTDAELIAFIHAHGLARQKTPEHFEFVDALPRTPSGKVRKDVLRELARQLSK